MSDLHEAYEEMIECTHEQGPAGPHGMRGLGFITTCDNSREWRDLVCEVSAAMKVDQYTAIQVLLSFARATWEANRLQLTDFCKAE